MTDASTSGASMTGATTLRALHHGRAPGDPLVLPNPWDAATARVLAAAGFPALATPSAGISASLGYRDGETPADEMFAAIARIARAVDVPVTADIEDGYGLAPAEIVDRLLEAGAVGCNLEDGDRAADALKDARRQADWLAEVRAAAGDGLVINARVDVFVRGEGARTDLTNPTDQDRLVEDRLVEEAIDRGRRYVAAGADCVYPIFAPPRLLPRLAAGIGAPLNAMADPDGPSIRELGESGATRITFGPRLLRRALAAVEDIAEQLRPS
ncbi:isocitrate lyase/phosphoenolpyruvate mutase family protein [Streptomyces sp. NBS 14/10]|uniref:isocitrate lyase/PEP mutase family protein n=1 Tax=Streptomyces sp. NBS 14/10 TaxID=1945643 RepID=UPI00211B41A7|nr:isocitrate lyase/phosphoenolpyruvate mutase family protein [Streptomyces sp. NBS 14/10]KAK1181301.1 isocitrate lyase/phosphoenolpyruvate mutase family protein [Streptomyces sp. NBS 14/10]